eukprot:SM000261S09974  [mRNA]  locus=s261:63886:68802:- [translate_table: standard]
MARGTVASTSASTEAKPQADAMAVAPRGAGPRAVKPEPIANGRRAGPLPPQSPRVPPTTSLRIDHFRRPFTQKQVLELLGQTGTVQAYWMDTIRTHCYVTYATVEEAVASRDVLQNLTWPSHAERPLAARFVSPAEVATKKEEEAAAKAAAEAEPPSPAAGAVLPQGPAQARPSERPAPPPRKEPEQPLPTLDDLFKKTKAKPSLYFLPLTDEQIRKARQG